MLQYFMGRTGSRNGKNRLFLILVYSLYCMKFHEYPCLFTPETLIDTKQFDVLFRESCQENLSPKPCLRFSGQIQYNGLNRKRGACRNLIIDATMEYIRDLFRENADGHGFEHSLRVYRSALRIAETEPAADRQIVSLAALLHDADDYKLFQTKDNANARRFLSGQGIDQETADRVCEAVNAVSFSKNKGKRPETIEGRIVQDADRLDAIGAVGIARTFAFGGSHGRSPEDSINHFYEKLLLLKDLMNTDEGKKMAETRHAYMEAFLEEWKKETEA